ncbi:helix-turn-helix domain-containing protein [Paenibacillus aquistagni]|uniref:helix-turn-helix domain-containing protein n=1 Tax=Paenibacillus aquistagni TaxID=1852522 RepID=UPI0027B9B406|nr:helix-turn-helix transcriptional regulator [Paenibacillus aquistagni]
MKGSDHKSKFLLTNREREVFELLVQDKTTRDIAQQLFISEKTVRNHISNVMEFEKADPFKNAACCMQISSALSK